MMFQKHKKEAKKFFVMIGKYLLITFLIFGNLLSGFPFVPEQATAQPGNPGNKIIPKIIDADIYHTVGIKSDGSGTAVGRSDRGQLNVGQWTDLVEVAAGLTHTVGLKSDGTVVATGNNGDGQTEVGDWTDIVQVDAGSYHTVGLKSDGTVVAVGQNVFGQIDVDDWTDIVQISAGNYHTVGLKSDGTVVAVGNDEYDDPYDIPIDVDDWTDIVQIEAGAEHTIGLKSDGTVVRAGYHEYIYQVNGWTDIVQIAAGKRHTVGLKSDGTVLRTEVAFEDLGDVSWWSDIVRIRAGYDNTIGVRNDGKIFVAYHTGTDSYGRSNITNWTVKTFVPKSPPDIITPGVQEVGSQVTLSWSDVEDWGYGEDTRKYHLQLYDGSSWRDLARNLTSTSWTGNLPGDVHTSKARVRVQAETEYGASAYTKSDTFRIGPPVPPYDLVYPTVSNEEKVIIEGKAEEDVTVEIDNGDITVNGTPDENGNFAIEVPLRTNQENTLILKAAVNGFESDPVSITVTHDDIPPAPPAIDVEKEGWTNDDHVTVTIEEGTDHESGIERTEYRLDEGEWQTYSDPFTVDSEGETLVTARSVDVAGNQSDETIQMIQIDRTPPAAPTINLSPEGWTNEEQVTVTIEDGTEDLSGVSHTEYRIGEGDWEVYEGPFTVGEEGETTITARTIDEVGHVGAETEKTVQIDWTPPAAPTINLDPEGWTNEEQVTVTIEDGTEDLSGVSHTEYRVGEGDWQVYEGPFTVQEEGETTITARTVDNVGYVGAEAEKTVQIDWMQPKAPTINLDPEGWTNEEQVTVTIEDGVVGTSGVQKTMFKIGEDGQEEEYAGSFTITDEGETKIYAYTVNNAGVKGEIKEVTVQINRNRPNIILKGDNPISLEVGDDYVDPGAEAYDDIDGDITDSIVIDDRLVDPLRLGNYEVIYTVTDSAGNIAQKKRIVNVMDTTKPDITLNGPNPVTVEVGDHYDDEGATAWDNYDGDLTEDIEIVNEVDTENIGTYNVTYRVMDSSGNIETAQRTVHVVDTTPPSIILKGDNPLTIHYGESYEEPGYEVVDRSGEQLNDQVEVSGELDTETIGEYTLTYNVKDSSGNRARAVTRTVHVVDQDHPEITLHEGDSIRLEVGQDYIEPGATAYDDYDGDLTNEIDISGEVDTTEPGTYTIIYSVQDSSNNRTTATRTVHVEKAENITISSVPLAVKVGESVDLEVIAMFSDGLKRDVATEAEYKISDSSALDIKKGTMTGKQASVQPVTVTVRFGELKKEIVLRVVNGHQSEWGEPVPIKASDLFWVEESETFIQAPPHLPEGSTIQVLPAHVSAPGLLPVGERFDIHLAFPNGFDTYTGTYHLTMGVHEEADISKTGIYYFNEQTERWEYVDGWGTAENGRIQIEVPHFSIYGVFTDNDGPSNVSLKEKQKTSNSVTLSFTAYDPSAIKSYVIERNGEKIAEIDGNETEFTDTQLSPDQTYLYTLKAIDLLGNESEETTLRVTTDPVQTASEQNDEGTAKPAGQITDKKESKLPQTATFMYKWIAIGIALIAAGMVMIFIRRRNIQRVEN